MRTQSRVGKKPIVIMSLYGMLTCAVSLHEMTEWLAWQFCSMRYY